MAACLSLHRIGEITSMVRQLLRYSIDFWPLLTTRFSNELCFWVAFLIIYYLKLNSNSTSELNPHFRCCGKKGPDPEGVPSKPGEPLTDPLISSNGDGPGGKSPPGSGDLSSGNIPYIDELEDQPENVNRSITDLFFQKSRLQPQQSQESISSKIVQRSILVCQTHIVILIQAFPVDVTTKMPKAFDS